MLTSLKSHDSIMARLIDFTLFVAIIFGVLLAVVLVYYAFFGTNTLLVEQFMVLMLAVLCVLAVYPFLQVRLTRGNHVEITWWAVL